MLNGAKELVKSVNNPINFHSDRKMIFSIQTLRAIAFLLIFLGHCNVILSGFSALAVSVFIVLSGFLMELNYEDRELNIGVKAQTCFAWQKIGKLYPLHIVCMLCMLVLAIRGASDSKELAKVIAEALLNTALLQSWFPSALIAMSLNGVAWYLSTCLFLYFMFPLIRIWIKKYKGINHSILSCIIIFVLMILFRIAFSKIIGADGTFLLWFGYCFPIYRLGDFFVGCNLGYIVKRIPDTGKKNISITLTEIVVFILGIAASIIQSNTFSSKVWEIVFTPAIIFLPISIMLVFLFYKNNGLLSKVLTNRFTVWIGNMSPYLFLFHYAVIAWTRFICEKALGSANRIIVTTASLLISIAAVEIYQIILRKVVKK